MTVTAACISTRLPDELGPLTQFGGLSLLKRALLTAQRVGARVCYVLARNEEVVALRREVADDARLSCEVVWVTPHGAPVPRPTEAGGCLVFSCDTLFRPDVARAVKDTDTPAGAGRRVIGRGATLSIVSRAELDALLDGWQADERLPDPDVASGCDVSAGTAFLERLPSPDARADLERAFLLQLENPNDGLMDTLLNRKLSRPLTRVFLRTPFTPNQVTGLSFLVGLFGAGCFLLGSYGWTLVGALLLQASTVLDCVDGEIARVKMLESPFGEWLDITLDTVVHIAIFIGVGVAVWKQVGLAAAPLLGGLLAAAALISFPLVTLAERTETRGRARGGWEDVWIAKLVGGLASRDYSLLILASAVAGKLDWFLWTAAVGAQAFWLVLLALLWKAGRFRRSMVTPPSLPDS